MYFSEVESILKSGPLSLRARRTCWNESYIIYDNHSNEFIYIRDTMIEGMQLTSSMLYYPSDSDSKKDDWEVYE